MTEEPSGSSVPRRQLGRALRALREEAGLTVEVAAVEIERSRPTIWKIETGQPGVRFRNADVKMMCEVYGASPEKTTELVALAEATKVKGWASSYSDILPPNLDLYVGLEVAADRIVWYEDLLIPGLLQTEDYTRAVVALPDPGSPERTEDEIEHRLSLRRHRQKLLTRRRPAAPRFEAIINECVLRRPIGGVAALVAQLRHLVELAKLPNISIRVLPQTIGLHYGLVSGQFSILTFPDGKGTPVVYADGFGPIQYFWDKPNEITRYRLAYESLSGQALDETASTAVIEAALKELASDA